MNDEDFDKEVRRVADIMKSKGILKRMSHTKNELIELYRAEDKKREKK